MNKIDFSAIFVARQSTMDFIHHRFYFCLSSFHSALSPGFFSEFLCWYGLRIYLPYMNWTTIAASSGPSSCVVGSSYIFINLFFLRIQFMEYLLVSASTMMCYGCFHRFGRCEHQRRRIEFISCISLIWFLSHFDWIFVNCNCFFIGPIHSHSIPFDLTFCSVSFAEHSDSTSKSPTQANWIRTNHIRSDPKNRMKMLKMCEWWK